METGRIIASLEILSPASGFLLCDGNSHLKTQYPQLFSLLYSIDTNYEISATHFKTPDFTNRVAVGGNAGLEVGSEFVNFENLPITDTGAGQPYAGGETAIMVNDYSGGGQDLSSTNTPIQVAFIPDGIGVNYYIKY
jgi:hypothetical protein